MALPREYRHQSCSMARALEIVGERWTLLIVRDAFFGVRRFSDFAAHLDIPRAVLTERLGFLVENGVLDRSPGDGRRQVYRLTDKGLELFPVIHALAGWGDRHLAPDGPRRIFSHETCGTVLDAGGRCAACRQDVSVEAIIVSPGPGARRPGPAADPITRALATPRKLLQPID